MFDAMWSGVATLIDDYAGVERGDAVLIVSTIDCVDAAALLSAALLSRRVDFVRVWMRPLVDSDFEGRLTEAITRYPSPRRLILFSFERDTFSHTEVIAKAMAFFPRDRRSAFRAIGVCDALFERALRATPDDLTRRNAFLLDRLSIATSIRVTTRGGSDVTIRLENNKHRWISNRGRARLGGTVILPAGEVATHPASVDGCFVADFAFNANCIVSRDARLEQAPVTLHLAGGEVGRIECADPVTLAFLEQMLDHPLARRVGEVGFGTNWHVDNPIPLNSHFNERRPGLHLGLGQHNQDEAVVPYYCPIHLDLIARGGLLFVDGASEPIDLDQFPDTQVVHPAFPLDEDVFSPNTVVIEDDCCGQNRHCVRL